MKPAMETAAEENAEQSQEKKVITRPEMEIGRYHWMYRSSRPHRYHHVPALRGNIKDVGYGFKNRLVIPHACPFNIWLESSERSYFVFLKLHFKSLGGI
uniref:Uncharacterized protein n=1 Tax=Strix occidentalis caurina TaxID=311401 RepID=A0A8D0EI55_STROC